MANSLRAIPKENKETLLPAAFKLGECSTCSSSSRSVGRAHSIIIISNPPLDLVTSVIQRIYCMHYT